MKNSCTIEQSRAEQSSLRALLRRSNFLRKCVNAVRAVRNEIRCCSFWKSYTKLFKNKECLEIGGPSEIFAPIYSRCKSCDGVNFSADTVWWTKGSSGKYIYDMRTLGNVYIADAVDMSCIRDDSYDFVMSSNNLEHIANPVKALKEFIRVLRSGGAVVVIVPVKQYTFDHRREYTLFEHMIEDYENDTPETDLTHLPEILELHDLAMDPPAGDIENFRRRSEHNYENRCLHHHVFCEDSLKKIFAYLSLEIIDCRECFRNYMIIGRKE